MKLKKEYLSRIIVAGLMAGSIGMYSNVSSAAEVQNGEVTLNNGEVITNIASQSDMQYVDKMIMDQVDRETAALEEKDTELGQQISDTQSDLDKTKQDITTVKEEMYNADADLKSQIDTNKADIKQEGLDRSEGDSILQGQIDDIQEVNKQQQSQINTNKADIKQEGLDRSEGDSILQGQIDDIQEVNKQQQEQISKVEQDYQAADDQVREDLTNDIQYVSGQIMDKVDDQQQQIEQNATDSQVRDNQLHNEIGQETAEREAADTVINDKINNQQQQINKVEQDYQAADDQVREDLTNDIQYVSGQIMDKVDEQQAQIDGINNVSGATSQQDLAQKYNNTNYLNGTTDMVSADRVLDKEIANVNNRVDSLEDRVGDVEDRIDKVGAMAAAIANLRTMGYDPEAPTEIAVGVGQYKSETGLALGVFHYPNEDFMLSASISTSSDEVMGGIGATWKIGRKSAAEKERTVEEKRVEKAEEMQDLAKKERVNAQRERHAKMLAEREAANK